MLPSRFQPRTVLIALLLLWLAAATAIELRRSAWLNLNDPELSPFLWRNTSTESEGLRVAAGLLRGLPATTRVTVEPSSESFTDAIPIALRIAYLAPAIEILPPGSKAPFALRIEQEGRSVTGHLTQTSSADHPDDRVPTSTPRFLVLSFIAGLLLACIGFGSIFSARTRFPYVFVEAGLFCYMILMSCTILAVPWSRLAIGVTVVLSTVYTLFRFRRIAGSTVSAGLTKSSRVSVLAIPAIAALGCAFLFYALKGWSIHPDFVFHWGLKGSRFALNQAVEWAWLGGEWAPWIHADYPLLLPVGYAAVTVAIGRWSEPLMLASTTIFWVLGVWAGAIVGKRLAIHPLASAISMLVVAFSLTQLGVGYFLAGGADLPIAASILLLAVPLASARLGRDTDAEIGIAAALSSSLKLEGVVVAGVAILLYLVRRTGTLQRSDLGSITCRALALPAAVLLFWAGGVLGFDLFQSANTGGEIGKNLIPAIEGVLQALKAPNWHGTAYLIFLLPLGMLRRRARTPTLLVAGALTFIVFAYASSPLDVRLLASTSGVRLLFQIMPLTLVILVALLIPDAGDSDSREAGG